MNTGWKGEDQVDPYCIQGRCRASGEPGAAQEGVQLETQRNRVILDLAKSNDLERKVTIELEILVIRKYCGSNK